MYNKYIASRILKIKRGYYLQILDVPIERRTVLNLFGPKDKLIETELRNIDDFYTDEELKQEKLKTINNSKVISEFINTLLENTGMEDLDGIL